MSPVLDIRNLTIAFKTASGFTTVLSDLNLSLIAGQCVGLVGESGSGKTITALSILQLLPHNARVSRDSQILFQEKNLLDVSEKNMRHVRGKKIAMVFQDAMSAFNPVFTIGQQLFETIRLHLHFNYRDTLAHAKKLLAQVEIQDIDRCLQSYPHELSGGMRQRAMIAMAIAAEPEIIIADEPTTALDPRVQSQVMQLLLKLKQEKNCALLFIGHDLTLVREMADDIVVLKSGKVVEKNNAETFFNHPQHEYSKQLLNAVLPATKRPDIHSDVLLSVEHLKQYFPIKKGIFKRTVDYVKAVDDISFQVKRGETVALIGESGSGKTTAAKSILQLLKNTDGDVIFDQTKLSSLSKSALRAKRKDMQIIFQDPFSALNPRMFIADSMLEGLRIQKKIKNKQMGYDIVDRALARVELDPAMKWRYPHEFSGGQRQRICIARALTLSPSLFILDEPTSALDVSTQKQILDLLLALQNQHHFAYLLITHNMNVVNYMAHRVYTMKQGKIMHD